MEDLPKNKLHPRNFGCPEGLSQTFFKNKLKFYMILLCLSLGEHFLAGSKLVSTHFFFRSWISDDNNFVPWVCTLNHLPRRRSPFVTNSVSSPAGMSLIPLDNRTPMLFKQSCAKSHGMSNDPSEVNQGNPIALSWWLTYKRAYALLLNKQT